LDFHDDLFPDCFVEGSAVTAAEWLSGSNVIRERQSLNPEIRQKPKPVIDVPSEAPQPLHPLAASAARSEIDASTQPASDYPSTKSGPTIPSPFDDKRPTTEPPKSDYTRKFLVGWTHHPNTHFTSLPSLPTTSSSHRGLHSNSTYLAFPIAGLGGRVAYLSLDNPGRHENPPVLSNGSAIVDFALCPHSNFEDEDFPFTIACAGEDGCVNVFGLRGGEMVKLGSLGEMDRIVQIEWHPVALGLLTVLGVTLGTYEIRLWDFGKGKGKFQRIQLGYTVLSKFWALS
jgi:Type of WD40 repeat